MKRILCILLCLILCSSQGLASTNSLTLGIMATRDLTLRPLEMNQRDVVSVMNLVYEGLFRLDDDYMPQPNLAFSYEFSNEGQRLHIKLREDIRFHNGKTLTTDDVAATLDYMYELSGFDSDLNSEVPLEDRGLYYSTFYYIRSWEVVDELTMVFRLRRSCYGSLYALTFPILPRDEVRNAMPSGTGPYTYDGYDQGSSIWLTASRTWWQRTPQIRNIRVSIYEESETVLTAFDMRNVDVAVSRSINASRYSGSLNSFSLSARSHQLEVLLVNRAYSLFKSDDNGENLLRQAVYYAIDQTSLISSIYQGMASVAYTPIPSGIWLSNEQAVGDHYDPLMAASLLDSAGWKLANDGKRYKDGKSMPTLRLYVYDEPGSTVRTNAANKLREQLQAVGFSINVITWSRSDVTVKLRSGDYALALCAFNFDISPDPGFTITSTGSCNYTRYRNDDMNKILTSLRKAWTADEYRNIMLQIQEKFRRDLPYIPLYWRSSAVLSRSAFTNTRDIRELEIYRGIESFQD